MKLRTNNVPDDLKEVTKIAVKFYFDRYFTKRMKSRTELIKVSFRKQYNDENLAFAGPFDLDTPRLPTTFQVVFNDKYRDIPVREYLITLFHELTHVKQYCSGDLKSRPGYCVWKNEKIDPDTEYWDEPWEREALSIELGAYSLFHAAHPELHLDRWKPTFLGRAQTDWAKMRR